MNTPVEAFSTNDSGDDMSAVETIVRDVERALRGSSHCGLHSVRCSCVDGRVTLTGEVASFYLKQLAQTIVAHLDKDSGVDNQLRVVGHDPRPFDD